VATIERRGRLLVAEPLFERGRRHALDGRARAGAAEGELVLLGFGKRGPRVVRRLGRPDVARDVLEGLMLDRGLHRRFACAVDAEATEAAARGAGSHDGRRRDLTELPTFTVDPVTARDFDDAISARREGDEVRVWVHIADVSAYVRPSGAIEQEALRRATSVYVPGAVEPMLPHALSSDACSLVPGEDRAAVTVEMLMRGASVASVSFFRSTIRSDARLSYDQVDRIFSGRERAANPWGEPLAAARAVAAALRAKRDELEAALEVSSLEPSYLFDDGNVTGVFHEEQTESHELIEHLMILANEQVAGHLEDRRVPALYRVHERPDPASIERLVEKLASLGVPTPPVPEHVSPQQAAELAAEASRRVAAWVRRADARGREGLTALVLRSLKQATYSVRNVGHAGLGSARYCHFTSPIRRYPDLVCHRALLASLGLEEAAARAEELPEVAVHSSLAEREALKAERDAADVCSAFLLERVLAEAGGPAEALFEGEVVGVIGKGAFVRFGDEGFEGFLPARRLGEEWYSVNEAETALVGEESGRALHIGDPVAVEVERVHAPRGRVDLSPAGRR